MYQIQQETISVVLQKNLISNIYNADKYQNMKLNYAVLLEFQIKPCKAKIELLKNQTTALILCHNRAVMALERRN